METIHILALHLSFGGVEKAITNMANLFVERYHVEIICMYDLPNAPAYPLDPRIKVKYLTAYIPNRNEFKEAVRNKKIKAILHEGFYSAKVLLAKKRCLIKAIKEIKDGIIISTRNEDTVLVNRYRKKGVYTIAQLHHDHKFDKKLLKDFRQHYDHIDIFALLNQQLCDEVSEIMKNNHHTKCVVIPNFIDDVEEMHEYARDPIILSVGRLHSEKGYSRLIDIVSDLLKEHSDWHLQIVGDGEERDKLVEQIHKYRLEEQIHLLGAKSSEEIYRLMHQAQCYVMTSYTEGFGIVLVEAMACSLPSVAFDVRVGPRGIITDGADGYLIPDGDFIAMQEKITMLMENDEQFSQMSKQAYETAKHYMRSSIAETWFTILQRK